MTRTAVVFSPVYYRHNPGRGHPESARRLSAIVNELTRGQLSRSRNWEFVNPEKASVEEVRLVHDAEYIRYVKVLCKSGGGLLDSGDTLASPDSFETALYAVGGAVKAVRLVTQLKFKNAFALVRPPGHHAARFYGLGFCIFNNVAIAAQCLLHDSKLKRVLILDIDAHHGNGTQQIFYETDRILYVSLHEDPRGFPGTGFVNEVGERRGRGFNVNVPLPFRTSDQIYLKALREIMIPIVLQYRPQFILVSAGLDCHYSDPVGHLSLSALCYDKVFETIVTLASRVCSGRLVFILEGGYSVRFVGRIAASAVGRMSGSAYRVDDRVSASKKSVREQGEKVIKEVKKVQRSFWNLG
jgi:acetoin utilization deacetylase AcuC-like enzyme